jgi:phosphoribosylformylglycinamidine synthase
VALAESCFATSGLGAEVTLDGSAPAEYALFGESGARAIVSLASEQVPAIRQLARENQVALREIGKVTRDNVLRIQYKGRTVISAPVPALKDTWANSLERALKLP